MYDLLKLSVYLLGYFFSPFVSIGFAVSFCHLNELKHFLNSNKKKRVNTRKNLLFPTNDGHWLSRYIIRCIATKIIPNSIKIIFLNVQISIQIFSSSVEKQKKKYHVKNIGNFFFQFTKLKRSGFQNWIL